MVCLMSSTAVLGLTCSSMKWLSIVLTLIVISFACSIRPADWLLCLIIVLVVVALHDGYLNWA